MKKQLLSVLAGTAAMLTLSAAPAEKTQTLLLDTFAVPQRWSPAESTVILAKERFNGRPVLEWKVKVDHFSGEKNYPVGWPRMYFQTFYRKPAVLSDWREWDYFEFDVKMLLNDDPANKNCTVSFMIATPSARLNIPLRKWHDGKLHAVKLPVDQLKSPQKITRFGFSISESNYKHGAKLTVLAGNFRLTRSSECFVESLKLLTPAITAADNAVKINIHISGPAGDVARGVPFEVTALSSGKVLRRETLPVRRGIRDMEIETEDLHLTPGQYKLTVFPGSKAKTKSVVFAVTSSPFQVKK